MTAAPYSGSYPPPRPATVEPLAMASAWASANPPSTLPPPSQANGYPKPYFPPPPPSAPSPAQALSKEEEDRAQLEKIIRLRRELEREQEREQQTLRELHTWGCVECTYRNELDRTECEMCGMGRPGLVKRNSTPIATARRNEPTAIHTSLPSQAPGPMTAWQCDICLAPNEATRERCKMCSAFRKNGIPPRATYENLSNRVCQQTTAAKATVTLHTKWRCSICATINEFSCSNCTACNSYQRNGIPLTEEGNAAMGSSAGGGGAYSTNSLADSASTLPTNWACSVCSLENPVSVAVCKACESGQRPRHLAPKDTSKNKFSASTTASTGLQGKNEFSGRESNRAGPTEWPCSTCTFVNRIELNKCDMCGDTRPQKYGLSATETSKQNKNREEESDEDEVQWQENHVAKVCNRCQNEFGLMRRRHHCRICGYVFCATCSPFLIVLKKGSEPVRACAQCYEARKEKG
ncbi:unnamed protein product [Phytomonas sp. Hart1]|nr:unnamed protein product [Phytomonas sp. Hart1]|eukprot:CCW69180.1 unnamed protein product [Phytomonas sp. isolate Hart1]